MNEQQMLTVLMKNPEFKKAFKEMLLHDKDLAAEFGMPAQEKNIYVWCAEMTSVSGDAFYHPIVIPANGMMITDVDFMMHPENYTMMASENQFDAYEHEPILKMFRSAYGSVPVRLIAVPEDTFAKLKIALSVLVTNIIGEVNNCFDHIDRIAVMANTKAEMLKMNLLASIFGNMTTVAACFDREMNLHDSKDHEYVVEDNYDYDGYDDEDWDDEDYED
jgi:hypothetical protein